MCQVTGRAGKHLKPEAFSSHIYAYLHGHDAPEGVEGGVGDVEAAAVPPGHHHDNDVDGDDVDDEHVTPPGSHHVEVRQGLSRFCSFFVFATKW